MRVAIVSLLQTALAATALAYIRIPADIRLAPSPAPDTLRAVLGTALAVWLSAGIVWTRAKRISTGWLWLLLVGIWIHVPLHGVLIQMILLVLALWMMMLLFNKLTPIQEALMYDTTRPRQVLLKDKLAVDQCVDGLYLAFTLGIVGFAVDVIAQNGAWYVLGQRSAKDA